MAKSPARTTSPSPSRLPRTRKATRSDLTHLASIAALDPLFQQYGMTEASALLLLTRSLRASLASASPTELWVAVDRKNQPIGFALFVRHAGFLRSTYLRLIAVDPTLKRGGIGRALMERMERQALQPHGILLLVTSRNRKARRFYEALGYEKVGLLRDYVRAGLHECVYFKKPGPLKTRRS